MTENNQSADDRPSRGEQQDGDENRTCDYGTDEDCNNKAVAIYEGVDPPAGTIRFAACNDHAPDDIPPIRRIGDRLATDGGTTQSDDDEYRPHAAPHGVEKR